MYHTSIEIKHSDQWYVTAAYAGFYKHSAHRNIWSCASAVARYGFAIARLALVNWIAAWAKPVGNTSPEELAQYLGCRDRWARLLGV